MDDYQLVVLRYLIRLLTGGPRKTVINWWFMEQLLGNELVVQWKLERLSTGGSMKLAWTSGCSIGASMFYAAINRTCINLWFLFVNVHIYRRIS